MLLLHTEFGTAMLLEHVELFERALIQQDLDPLTRGQLAFGMLGIDPPLSATHPGRIPTLFQFRQNVSHLVLPISKSAAVLGRVDELEMPALRVKQDTAIWRGMPLERTADTPCGSFPSISYLLSHEIRLLFVHMA
jgi:hypothetical protein